MGVLCDDGVGVVIAVRCPRAKERECKKCHSRTDSGDSDLWRIFPLSLHTTNSQRRKKMKKNKKKWKRPVSGRACDGTASHAKGDKVVVMSERSRIWTEVTNTHREKKGLMRAEFLDFEIEIGIKRL